MTHFTNYDDPDFFKTEVTDDRTELQKALDEVLANCSPYTYDTITYLINELESKNETMLKDIREVFPFIKTDESEESDTISKTFLYNKLKRFE